MSRKVRLSRAELSEAGKPSARIGGKCFSLVVSPLTGGRNAAFTSVVSKRIATTAAARNKIKRLCREAARPRVKKIQKPLALVFYAKKEAGGASFQEVERDIAALLRRI